MGGPSVALGPQNASQALRFLLPTAKRTRHLYGHRCIRQVDGKVGHLGHHQKPLLALAERLVQALTFLGGGFTRDDGRLEVKRQLFELFDELSNDQHQIVGVLGHQRFHHLHFGQGGGADAVADVGLRQCIRHALVVGERDPDLDTFGRGNPALRFEVFPRHVVTLGSNEGEHVRFPSVFADERGGETQSPAALQIRRGPEYRGWQQMYFVIDHEAPVLGIEHVEMAVLTLGFGDHHLIRGDGDRTDLLAFTGVLADVIRAQTGTGQQLIAPLPGRHGVGDEDEGGGLSAGHGGHTHHGFARPARKHHHTTAPIPKSIGGRLLIGAHTEVVVLHHGHGQGGAFHISGPILGRPTHFQQRLLEPTTSGRLDRHHVGSHQIPQ